MLKRLWNRVFRRNRLTRVQRMAVFIAMIQRSRDQIDGKPVESISDLLIRSGVKQP